MSTQARGAARERQFADRLRDQGWIVKGHGDAHGTTDLLCARSGEVLLVQVKANKGNAWMNFRPAERRIMKEEARAAGGQAVLIWWPPDRQGPRWLWAETWPEGG